MSSLEKVNTHPQTPNSQLYLGTAEAKARKAVERSPDNYGYSNRSYGHSADKVPVDPRILEAGRLKGLGLEIILKINSLLNSPQSTALNTSNLSINTASLLKAINFANTVPNLNGALNKACTKLEPFSHVIGDQLFNQLKDIQVQVSNLSKPQQTPELSQPTNS
jgi:hypothetical protein